MLLDRQAVRALDRAAIEEYGIPGIVLMENAARGLADQAMALLERSHATAAPTVLIICGSGNNGGDGYALARHLRNRACRVLLAPIAKPRAGTDAAANRDVCRAMKIPEIKIEDLDEHAEADLLVDAIFGTGLDREVSGRPASIIRWINRSARPVLAVDIPSGLDCDTGRPLSEAVRATRTATFVGVKPGLLRLDAQPYVGEVVVAEIGAPAELLERFGRPLGAEHRDERSEIDDPQTPTRR